VRKIIITLASLCFMAALAVVGVVATSTPAQAGEVCDRTGVCGDFYHIAPDNGADGPILVTCNLGDPWNNTQWVYEGGRASCKDTDAFFVGAGERVSCRYLSDMGWYNWRNFQPASGTWFKLYDSDNYECVRGAPN
jgi:hypothetical protein